MIPKIIHHTAREMTWEEKQVVAEAKRMMPDFEFKFWDDAANLALVQKLCPQHVEAYQGFKAGVIRADVARCLYMHEYGGIYADTDYRFLRKPDDAFLSHECVLGIEEVDNKAVGGGYKVGNAFLASSKGFELWLPFVDSIFERHRQGEDRVVFMSGPHALSIFLKEHKEFESRVTMLPPETIYPPFRMAKLKTYRDQTTIGAHLCWGSWRNKGMVQGLKSRARRLISAVI